MLTNNEKELICQAVADLESGNYLIRPRSVWELEMIRHIGSLIHEVKECGKTLEGHDAEIWEEYLHDIGE